MKKPPDTGIDTIEKLTVGGIPQWISLRSDNAENPIILFLHGGPGTAQIALSRKSQKSLEDSFLVVNWDQRGAGRSYSRSLSKEDMTIDRFVRDTEELIEYLVHRFGQEKIYLVGHSWGSIPGAYLAAKRPDLLWAYIAIGQVVDMVRGELISYQFTLAEAKRRNHKKALRQLTRIGPPPYAHFRHEGVQRKWLSKFQGSTHEGTLGGKVLKSVTLRDLRPMDIFRFVAGAIFSLGALEDELNKLNILQEVQLMHVPAYFCCGRTDYQVPSELVVEYVQKLQAPEKQIIWFERSGHAANLEEPEAFCDFCKSLLKTEGQAHASGNA